MPSIYFEQKGKPAERVMHGSATEVHALMTKLAREAAKKGFKVVGAWNDWVARDMGGPVFGYYVNEVSGSHDEVSGPAPSKQGA